MVLRRPCGLSVPHESDTVLPLEVHVHHVFLPVDVLAHVTALVRHAVIHLDIADRIIRQVVEHHLVVALEEVLAVEHQIVHGTSVDLDDPIGTHLHTRHLTYQGIEHTAVGQLEGRGVKHNRIAAVGHLHTCGPYRHLAQLHVEVGLCLHPPLHVMPGSVEETVAGYILYMVVHVAVLIVGMGGADEEASRLGRQEEAEVGVRATIAGIVTGHTRVYHGTVGIHQRDFHVLYRSFGKRIAHMSPQHKRVFLLSRLGNCRLRNGRDDKQQRNDTTDETVPADYDWVLGLFHKCKKYLFSYRS